MSIRARIDAAFHDAIERDDDARSEFLAGLRDTDPDVAEEVEALLRAHDVNDGILDLASRPKPTPPPIPAERRIGPYRVLQELGRGGMGVVYLAERDDGHFRRRVAVKLLRNSPDADELHQRFVAERQILAILAHPNIAQLIDGGVTDGQLPYLVMEYVEGMPITHYCERHGLSIPDRLRLFQEVCAAVHHAHRNLVLHRDLKPGNMLVTQEGQVKLLDFGIAKLLNPGLSAVASPVTWASQRVLTPEYASPEQLRGEPLSTTSDVYALGVVLYELLTGRRPHESPDSSYQDLVKRICDEEPVKPSDICTAREFCRELRGDLDAIVLMALRKEPGRRYGSADLLADDINRYLEGLPVLAHKGSRAYYIRKFASRHRISVIAAGIVATSVVLGAGVALRQTHTARAERDRAQQALREAETVTSFLVSMFEANDPDQSQGQQPTARDLLRRGLQRVEQLSGQPVQQARMLQTIGTVYHSMGRYMEARPLLERALAIRESQFGPNSLQVAQTLTSLAEVYRYLSRFADANAAAERALDIRTRVLGANHPDVATSMMQVATMAVYLTKVQRSIDLTVKAVAIREANFGRNDTSVANALVHLGLRQARLGPSETAERNIKRGIAIHEAAGPETSQLASAIMGLGYLYATMPSKVAEAEALFRQGWQMRRRTLGDDHPLTNYALGDLVEFLATHGRAREALPLARVHVERAKRLFGADNARTALIMLTYAKALRDAGDYDQGIAVAREAIKIIAPINGTQNAQYGGALFDLGTILEKKGDTAEAERLVQQAIDIALQLAGGREGGVAKGYTELAVIQMKAGRYQDAEASLKHALRIFEEWHVRRDHQDYQRALHTAVSFYETTGRKPLADRYRELIVN